VNTKGHIYKKLHKWPGLILSFFLLYFGLTGIIMNHRGFFSSIDVDRNWLPREYAYTHWNNGALKGNLIVAPDSILVYGSIGVWVTDSVFREYRPLNHGFRTGADNRKIFDLHRSPNGNLYTATQFGLFAFDTLSSSWKKMDLDVDIHRFVGLASIGDTLFALNRSYLFKGLSNGTNTRFEKLELEQPEGYVQEVSLFETIWQIHSGEIFGMPGKLFVDILGLITIFLSLTGIIYFFFPGWIKKRRRSNKPVKALAKTNKWSLKWHNYTGAWLFVFLIILYFSGMFLRPPMLIAIARSQVAPIKFSHLDQPNPWYDKLRDIHYDAGKNRMMLSTSDGMFFLRPNTLRPVKFPIQPPVSVMGINTFSPHGDGSYLIGSFSGMFLWHPHHPQIIDYARGLVHTPSPSGRPVGEFKVSGCITDIDGRQYMIDYDKGAIPLWHGKEFPQMPENVLQHSKMSLWSFCLEVHTGRMFSFFFGNFYILIVPLASLVSVMVVISGYLLWRKRYRKKTN
jgi:hypothetical protein